MITRQHRFHGHGSLRFAYQKGTSVHASCCTLRFVLNTRRDTWRMAVVVSRKVHKSAVVRNRIRRRIYEAARPLLTEVTKPYDLVFTVYGEQIASMDSTLVHDMVASQLTKAGVLA